MTLGLQDLVERKPDEVALVDEFGQWTWAEINARQNQLIAGLRHAGLQPGDVVGLLGNNRHEWPETVGAVRHGSWMGVPINWHFSTDEIAYVLENSGARALVADVEFAGKAVEAAEQAGVAVRIAFGGPIEGFVEHGTPTMSNWKRAISCSWGRPAVARPCWPKPWPST